MRQLKKYLRKCRVRFGMSANMHKGIQFNAEALNPEQMDMIESSYRMTQSAHPFWILPHYMKPLKIAYRILECINGISAIIYKGT